MSVARTPLAAIAVLVGLVTLTACGPGSTASPATPTPTPPPTATPTTPAAVTARSSPSTPSTTTTTTSAAPNYTPIGKNAAAQKGLDFGLLKQVTARNGVVTISFDRAEFYTGKAAIAHNGGTAPDDDYIIVNSSPRIRVFRIDPKAPIRASNALDDNLSSPTWQALTLSRFVHNAQAILDLDQGVPIWIRHTNGLTGPITALTEQFLP